jgi:stress response protein YsnF
LVTPPNEFPQDETVLPVVEERLNVTRRKVDTGAVRVRKLVHEEAVELNRHHVTETVDTARVPIGRVVPAPVAIRQEGDTTVVPVMEERMVVHKELVLVEELRITRRREVRQVPELVTLRRESVVVERLDPATGEWHPAGPAPADTETAPDPDPPERG